MTINKSYTEIIFHETLIHSTITLFVYVFFLLASNRLELGIQHALWTASQILELFFWENLRVVLDLGTELEPTSKTQQKLY